MKTIKFKYFSHFFIVSSFLLASACMPDSLTKLKQDPPKKDGANGNKPSVIVGPGGTNVNTSDIVPTTKFFYVSEASTFEGIYTVGKSTTTISPTINGSLSQLSSSIAKALFVSCEVISSTDGNNRFPAGISFVGGDSKFSTSNCALDVKPEEVSTYRNPTTNTFESVSYTLRLTFRNASNTITTLDTSIKLAALLEPKNLVMSQTSTLILGLGSVNDFASFDLSPKVTSNKGSVSTIKYKDSVNKILYVTRDNNNLISVGDEVDNASTYYNSEGKINSTVNVIVVNERLETTYASYPTTCPTAPGPTSKLYVRSSDQSLLANNMITYSITPDLPPTVKLCNYTDVATPGDTCYCRLPGEMVGYFDTVTNLTEYTVKAFNNVVDGSNTSSSTLRLVVSESPEGFNIAQRQLLKVANRIDFEFGETVSEMVAPPLSSSQTAKGRVLRSFSLDTDADGTDEEYIDVELLRGRFKKDSSIDNARFFYAQNTIVLDKPFDYNLSLKLNNASDFTPNQYITGFLHDSSKRAGLWTSGGGFSPANFCTGGFNAANVGRYYEVAEDGNLGGLNGITTVKKLDKLACNGIQLIRETPTSFSKGYIRFVDTTSNIVYISSSYESYSDLRHPSVSTPFEQYQTTYEGLSLGAWNPTMTYFLGNWNASTGLPTAATCTTSLLNKFYVVNVAGNGYAIGDRVQCVTAGVAWVKRTENELRNSPDTEVSCTPSNKYYKVSKTIPVSASNITTNAGLTGLSACSSALHGEYHTIASAGITATLDGNSTWSLNDLVLCSFDNRWVRLGATSPLRSFLINQAGGSIFQDDIVYCDAATSTWKKTVAASSTFQHSYSTELHSKSQVVKMASNHEAFYGRDLSASNASAYIVHTKKTDNSISSDTFLRLKDVKGFFSINAQAVAHSEFRSQNDASYAPTGTSFHPSFLSTLTNVERVYDDNTFYLERGEFTIIYPSTLRGGGVFYSITPTLPVGLSFNATTGEISGTPQTAAALREYTITIQNAISSITYKFKLEVIDYFKVHEVNPSIYTAYLHKSGQNQHFRECKINSRDINSPYNNGSLNDVTPLDVSCYMDIGENDLKLFGLQFAHSVGGGVCNFVTYEPMAYWSGAPFTSTDSTTDITKRIKVEKSGFCNAVATGEIIPGTTLNAGNYIGTKPAPKGDVCASFYNDKLNCDSGEYTVYNYNFTETDPATATETCQVSVTTEKVTCGGKRANCLKGPIRDLLTTQEIEDGFIGKFVAGSDGVDNRSSPFRVKPLIRAFTNASFTLNNSCTISNYLYQHGRWGKNFDPTSSTNYGRAINESAPSYMTIPAAGATPSTTPNAETSCDAATDLGRTAAVATAGGSNFDDIYLCVTDTSLMPTGLLQYKYKNIGKRWQLVGNAGPKSSFWTWPGSGNYYASPYYTFYCQDSAREIKARIRVAVRDWDLEITPRDIGGGIYPLRLIDQVNPPNNVMDNATSDPFGLAYNSYSDIDDYVSDAGAIMGANRCGSDDPVPFTYDPN